MSKSMDKKMMWSVVAAGVLVAAIVIVMMQQKADDIDMFGYPSGHKNGTTPPPTPSTGNAGNLAYNEALKKYGTNRIQINDACQTTPKTVTYKAGTQVMFDNRSAGGHTITFRGTKYTIAGYGYKVLTMTAATYPTTVLLDCDTSQNVATILIQK